MVDPRRSIWSVCIVCAACRPDGHVVQPAADEIEVVAMSTMGYGCIVPPFLVSEPEDDGCGDDRDAYVLTRTDAIDPAEGPPGRYRIVGRWADARSTFAAWSRARGEAPGEGAPADDVAFRVLVVSDWCVERRSVPAAYRKHSDLAPATAPWRSHVCRD